MNQTRIFFVVEEHETAGLFHRLEAAFEEDGWPIASTDLGNNSHEISIYVEGDPQQAESRILQHLGAESSLILSRENVADIDWVAYSLQGLRPVRAARFIVHGAHDRFSLPANMIGIEIEAGQAFGTGHHGTTAGCLEMLAAIVRTKRPARVLDLGTGSAVLAIGVAKLARVPVLASDIDAIAVGVARRNVRSNGVAAYVRTVTANGFRHSAISAAAPFDLIIANILARPLMRLAPQMAALVAPGGSVILSGILSEQRRALLAAYCGQNFRHIRSIWRDGWVTLHLKR